MNKKVFNVCLLVVAIAAFVLFGVAMANPGFANGWILPTVLFLGAGLLFLVQGAVRKNAPAHLLGTLLFALGALSLALMLTLMWYWCIIIFVVAKVIFKFRRPVRSQKAGARKEAAKDAQ